MKKSLKLGACLFLLAGSATAAAQDAPSAYTIEANRRAAEAVGGFDARDIEEAHRGKLAEIPGGTIRNARGEIVWDMSAYGFLDGPAPATVNPLLWRQAQLNAIHGLFEVVPGAIYQVRGYDVAVMTLIRGKTGWIVVDPLMTEESARASFELAQRTLGNLPVKALIFTHSHGDHFGGAGGIVSPRDIREQGIRVIAPHGFADHAIAENILAGPAMNRRTTFQFGELIAVSPRGMVDAGIGKRLSVGTTGLTLPTESIGPEGGTLDIDGVTFEFVDAEGSEAPSEFVFYLPQYKALCTSEIATKTLHNVLTMRGALVRDALRWSQYIDLLAQRYGGKAEVVFNSHNWPSWGRERVARYLTDQRNVYRYIHDQTLRQANNGSTLHEMADATPLPPMMAREASTRGYYGSLQHNMKATYQRYFGWWDGNPANFMPLAPEAAGKGYVDLAGGSAALIVKAKAAAASGNYRWAAELLNHLVMAEPDNRDGRGALAGVYDQLGYQAETASWRNYYLSAAAELREKMLDRGVVNTLSPSFLAAVPTGSIFDAMATRLDPAKADGRKMLLTFRFADSGETVGVTLEDNVEFPRPGVAAVDAGVTLTLNRPQFLRWIAGALPTQALLADEAVKVEGRAALLDEWLAMHPAFPKSFGISLP